MAMNNYAPGSHTDKNSPWQREDKQTTFNPALPPADCAKCQEQDTLDNDTDLCIKCWKPEPVLSDIDFP